MDITVSSGSSALLVWPLVDANGNPINLTGQTITFEVFQNTVPDQTTLYTLTNGAAVTITGTGNNQVQVSLTGAQTALPGFCRYEVTVAGSVAVTGKITASLSPNYTYSNSTVVVIAGAPGAAGSTGVVSATGTAPISLAYNSTSHSVTGSISPATDSAAGSMSSADKAKLDGLPSTITTPTLDSVLAAGATSARTLTLTAGDNSVELAGDSIYLNGNDFYLGGGFLYGGGGSLIDIAGGIDFGNGATLGTSGAGGLVIVDENANSYQFENGHSQNGGTGFGNNAQLSINANGSGVAADFNAEVDIGSGGSYTDPSPGYGYDLKCGGVNGGITSIGAINTNTGFLVGNSTVIDGDGNITAGSISGTAISGTAISGTTLTVSTSIACTAGSITAQGITVTKAVACGYVSTNIVTVSGITTYYVTVAGASTVLVNNTGAGTVYLPPAASYTGRHCTVKSIGTGVITVQNNGSGNIEGATTYSLSAKYKYVTVQSDGTNWWIIANN